MCIRDSPIEPVQGWKPVYKNIPPYGHRQGFIPRKAADFGDGGAFPEIHVAQYPLNMGKKDQVEKAVVPVSLNEDGKLKYESILGHGPKGQKVHARALAMKEKHMERDDLERPDEDTEAEIIAQTHAAIFGDDTKKPAANGDKAKYIRYIPKGSQEQKIIRLVQKPVDPMEPPKFKHKRVPGGPPEPPVPVMHDAAPKLTKADQEAWRIPPCVSNWKNAKGYTIPLDKRLAADGRGIQTVQINDNFAKLSEALYVASRKAREEVQIRAEIQRNQIARQRALRQQKLQALANKVRMDQEGDDQDEDDVSDNDNENGLDSDEELMSRQERDELRYERRRERQRQRHISNYKGKKGIDRDTGRDISEKIALGEAVPTRKDTLFDQRLFNQDQGISAGFGNDDAYNIYDKPLFEGSSANTLFRPRTGDGDVYGQQSAEDIINTDRFKPDRDFSGVDRSQQSKRSGPVDFEPSKRSDDENDGEDEVDPLGLDSFLTEVSESHRRNPLGKIGQKGQMSASSSSNYEKMREQGLKRDRLEFQSATTDGSNAREDECTQRDVEEVAPAGNERKRRRSRSRSRSPRRSEDSRHSSKRHRDHHSHSTDRDRDRSRHRSRDHDRHSRHSERRRHQRSERRSRTSSRSGRH
eukprot:TRINITY_DN13204_c0_g1_i1.p1 TRINITY_DN13204_c0_g1~~TRINITY_DN13204_c0_g1_i1.p1  ORF type:complete len:639 (+),score=134.32 TRINITY_DN13204_c0_g1_i1:36-1952(+)